MEQAAVSTLKPLIISIIGATVTFIGGFCLWWFNERSKRIYEEYKRKEEKYSEMVRSLRGFYVGLFNEALRNEFLNQLNLCWMYCPDQVVRKAYDFLLTVHTDRHCSDDEKEKAVGELILAIRKDLISRIPLRKTELKPGEFRHLTAT